MIDNPILDIAIGLVFIYLLYSLLASTISELIATFLSLRSKTLVVGLEQILDGKYNIGKAQRSNNPLVKLFMAHPLYQRSCRQNGKNPSYLSADIFTDIILDLLKEQVVTQTVNGKEQKMAEPLLLADVRNLIAENKILGDAPDLQRILNIYLDEANGDINRFKAAIGQWYDLTMTRVSGWYKKRNSYILLAIGFTLAVIFNVDSIRICNRLSGDEQLRKIMVANAIEYVKQHPDGVPADNTIAILNRADSTQTDSTATAGAQAGIDSLNKKLAALQTTYDSLIAPTNTTLGLGWKKKDGEVDIRATLNQNPYWFWLGWLITALAISMGAPFWFDLLNKFINLRGSGNKPLASSDQAQQMQQPQLSPKPGSEG